MAALNNANKLKTLLTWFLLARKKRKFNNTLRQITFGRRKFRQKRMAIFKVIIAICLSCPRIRETWMHPRSFTWFEMVDEHYDNELWYENFRVTRQTFLYLFNTVANFISCKDAVNAIFCFCKKTACYYPILPSVNGCIQNDSKFVWSVKIFCLLLYKKCLQRSDQPIIECCQFSSQ